MIFPTDTKYAVVGSRTFDDSELMDLWLRRLTKVGDTIISGAAAGTDQLAAEWAKIHGIKLIEYPADWNKHGRSAGFIRNEKIINEAEIVIAFWDGISKGTAHDLNLAKKMKKPTVIIYF